MEYKCFASCSFGLESITSMELRRLGFQDIAAKDARVYFFADKQGIARANIRLRSADRIYIELKSFVAKTFDELFEGVKAFEWENYIPKDANFPVNADSIEIILFSTVSLVD